MWYLDWMNSLRINIMMQKRIYELVMPIIKLDVGQLIPWRKITVYTAIFIPALRHCKLQESAKGANICAKFSKHYNKFLLDVNKYAAPASHLSVKQTSELNVCWNTVFRRIFRYNKWESVRAVIDGCGRLDVKHLIILRRIQFFRHIFIWMIVY